MVCLAILGLSYVLAWNPVTNTDSFSPYECGFEASGDARNSFDVRFYLVGILFLIFDLELIFFVPWALTLSLAPWMSVFSMLLFLVILTAGFLYEWKKGALDW